MANLHLVTGYAGQSHIKAADHGSLNAAIIGDGNYVLNRGNKFSATAITSNTVRVLDGDLLLQGRHVRLESYVDLTITSGTQGMKRHDLIVARYTKNNSTGVEECNLVVIKGTAATSPKDPAYTDGDILAGSDIQADFPLYRVELNGVNIVAVTPIFETIVVVTVGADRKIKKDFIPGLDYLSGDDLSSSVNSTSTTKAATSYAVKQAYDKAKDATLEYKSIGTLSGDNRISQTLYGRVCVIDIELCEDSTKSQSVVYNFDLPAAPASSDEIAAATYAQVSSYVHAYVSLEKGSLEATVTCKKSSSSGETVHIRFMYITE